MKRTRSFFGTDKTTKITPESRGMGLIADALAVQREPWGGVVEHTFSQDSKSKKPICVMTVLIDISIPADSSQESERHKEDILAFISSWGADIITPSVISTDEFDGMCSNFNGSEDKKGHSRSRNLFFGVTGDDTLFNLSVDMRVKYSKAKNSVYQKIKSRVEVKRAALDSEGNNNSPSQPAPPGVKLDSAIK